jgi:outer membrane immunogenic protein
MKKIIAAAVLALASIAPAIAADVAEDVVIVDPAYDWSGVYIGVQAGYGWGSNDYSALGSAVDFDSDGFVGGLTAGANWQSGAFVYGVEADISYSDVDGSFVGPNTGFIPCADAGCTAEMEWFGTGRARLGYAVGNLLPFVTGGFAVGGLEGTADTQACDLPAGSVCSYDDTEFGWTAGAGIEWGLTQKVSVKAEYLHIEFGTPEFNNAATGNARVDDITVDTVRIGLNYRF